jgi:hypothetical protein
VTGNKNKVNKMGIFVSAVRHNYDQKTVTEKKIQFNVSQYKIGKYSRVASHLYTGSLAGIGKLLALASWYIRSVFCVL